MSLKILDVENFSDYKEMVKNSDPETIYWLHVLFYNKSFDSDNISLEKLGQWLKSILAFTNKTKIVNLLEKQIQSLDNITNNPTVKFLSCVIPLFPNLNPENIFSILTLLLPHHLDIITAILSDYKLLSYKLMLVSVEKLRDIKKILRFIAAIIPNIKHDAYIEKLYCLFNNDSLDAEKKQDTKAKINAEPS